MEKVVLRKVEMVDQELIREIVNCIVRSVDPEKIDLETAQKVSQP